MDNNNNKITVATKPRKGNDIIITIRTLAKEEKNYNRVNSNKQRRAKSWI